MVTVIGPPANANALPNKPTAVVAFANATTDAPSAVTIFTPKIIETSCKPLIAISKNLVNFSDRTNASAFLAKSVTALIVFLIIGSALVPKEIAKPSTAESSDLKSPSMFAKLVAACSAAVCVPVSCLSRVLALPA